MSSREFKCQGVLCTGNHASSRHQPAKRMVMSNKRKIGVLARRFAFDNNYVVS